MAFALGLRGQRARVGPDQSAVLVEDRLTAHAGIDARVEMKRRIIDDRAIALGREDLDDS